MEIDRSFSTRTEAGPGAPLILVFDEATSPDDASLGPTVARIIGPEVNAIILIDASRVGFYRGVPGLGDTVEATVAGLLAKVRDMAPSRVVVIGSGMGGGHAALVYGVLLGASRIVAVEPVAHLVEADLEAYHDHRWRTELASLPDPGVARRFEVTGLITRSDYGGEAHVLFGSHRATDHRDYVHLNLIHAQWLARSPRVTLHPFVEVGSGMGSRLLDHHKAAELVARLVLDPAPSTPPAPLRFGEAANARSDQRPLVYNARLTTCRIEERNPANKTGGPITFVAAGEVDSTTTRKMDDNLRRWIVENILMDAAPKDLADKLLEQGISSRETLMEIDLARFHPYTVASKRLVNRINKRDWLLATYRKLDRMRRRPTEIERRDSLTREEFLRAYGSTGRPVLISGMIDWPAPGSWKLGELAQRLGSFPIISGEPTTLADFLGAIGGRDPDRSRTLEVDAHSTDRGLWDELSRNLGPLPEWLFPLDRPSETFWFGPAGSKPPPPSESVASIVVAVLGQVRVHLLLSWDVDLVERELRAAPEAETRPMAGIHFPPVDRPEILDFVLRPAEILYLPAGSQVRFECSEPSALVRFCPAFPDG